MAWVVMLTSIPWSGASANAQEYEDAQIIQEEILDEDVAVLEEQPVQNESSGTVSGENSGEEEIILQDNEEIVIESIVETADPSLDEGAEETANGEAAVPQTESEIALLTEEEGTEGQKEVTSLEWLSLPEKQTAVVSFDSDYYMDAQARVTYADGSSEDLYMYTMGIGGQSLCPLLYLRQEDGSAAAEGIDFYSADAGQTYFFGTNAGGKNYVSEQEIRILSPAECADGSVLTEGQPASFANTGETRAVSFTPKETAEYVFTVTGTSMVSRWDSEAEGFVSGALNGEGAFRVSLVAGTETWIVWKPQEGTETVSISVKKTSAEITGIAFSDLPASVSTFEFLDTVKGAVSVSYREGEQTWTEQIQNWQGGWIDYDILIGATESGDEIWIELQDSAGNPVNFSTSHYIGSYTLKAYPEAEPESEVHQEASILLEGIPETAVTVTEGAQTAPISVAQDTAAYYVFTPATTEEYIFEYQYLSDTGSVTPHLFCVDEEIFMDMGYIWSGQRISLEAGKSYLLRMEASMADVADLTVSFALPLRVTAVELSVQKEYSLMEMLRDDYDLSATVFYSDGSTEEIYWWQDNTESTEAGEVNIYTCWLSSGEYLTLRLFDREGGQVSIPRRYSEDAVPIGEFTLTASVDDETTLYETQLTISGAPEGTPEIALGQEISCESGAAHGGGVWFWIVPEQPGQYLLKKTGFYGDAYLLQIGETGARRIDESWGEEINFFLNAEAGARYALFLSTEEEEPYGNVSLQEPKRFLSMEADIPDTFEAFSVESELSELPVTVRYQDESSEIVSGWTTDWEEELGCNSMHAETSQGQRLLMYLTDADDNPADLPDYGYNIPVGPYSLHLLLQESGDAGELSKEIQIQLPQAEEIVPEQDYYVEITSDIPIAKSYRFRFTPDVETAGRMRIVDELHTNNLETSTEVYRFDSAAGRLIEMDAYSAVDFQVGVTYYIVGEIYNLDPATQKFSIRLEKIQSPESSTLTGMRLASPPDQTKYVEKIESVSGDGASALLTFEGGAEREVSFGDYYGDDYEYYLNEAIYKKEAGEAPTEEDRVDWWEDDPISEPGTYMLVAYAEGEDGSISFWTETPITVRSLQEASQDHRFDEEGETWIEGEGYQLYFVGFIPEADGRYEFEAGTALDLQIYQMDGLRVDILDQNDYSFSAELKGGQEYVIAVEPWRSGGFALRVGSRVEPVEILARLVAGRLVAGLDSFNPEDFLIDLRYSDESASVLRGDETDARGYRFRYEITDSEGKRVSDFSEAGLYYVKAAVYRTFSAISSEVVSEPVPVNLEKIETSGLETLEEETP